MIYTIDLCTIQIEAKLISIVFRDTYTFGKTIKKSKETFNTRFRIGYYSYKDKIQEGHTGDFKCTGDVLFFKLGRDTLLFSL